MKRTHVNFAIDGLAFAAFLFLMSTGLLLRYQLPPGSGSLQGAGGGHASALRPVGTLWSVTRHDWGTIHYWIAVFLLTILATHIILHWKWITCVVRGAHSEASGLRLVLGLTCALSLAAFAAAPLLAPTKLTTRGELQGGTDGETDIEPDRQRVLQGSMTIDEAAKATGMNVETLTEELGLPAETSDQERLGPTLRRHGMSMEDARRILRTPDVKETREQQIR
jgi:hypothetical protein